MSSRKDQKEALRRQRLERERQAQDAERRKRMVGYGAAAALVLAVVVVLGVLLVAGGGGGGGSNASADVLPSGGSVPKQKITSLGKAAAAAGCTMKKVKATSRQHTTNVHQRVRYSTNPPTSGKHYEFPADDGAYTKAPPDVTVVHAQEHGRVILWFKPSLPKQTRANLKALFDQEKGFQMLMVPREDMPYQAAETAWGRDPTPNGTGYLLGCTSVSDATFDAFRAFIDQHRGNGPEPVP